MLLHRDLAMAAALVLVVGVAAAPAGAVLEGPQMVGVGLPPDSVSFDRYTNPCIYSTGSAPGPGFRYWRHHENEINRDVELFISLSLSGAYEVTGPEAEELLQAVAWDTTNSNAFNVREKDIELITNYLSCVGGYDPGEGFEVFPSCASEIEAHERNHVDFYLVKLGTDADGGQYSSKFLHPLEDTPRTSVDSTFKWNSFSVSDADGNASGNPSWPQKVAVGAAHEFGHMLWFSNADSFGDRASHGDFGEFHAGVAGYVARTTWGGISGYDLPYAQSLLYLFEDQDGPVTTDCAEVTDCDSLYADLEDCMTGYRTRGMLIAYLMEHFHVRDDYTQDLLYQWARILDDEYGVLSRDMCGLARVLDDDNLYSDLGGDPPRPGNYRIRKVFHNYSIARWLDDATMSEYYSFGEGYSPTENAGLFRKISDDTLQCWENAVPPQFVVGDEAAGLWRHVPGNASDPADLDCDDGWNDPTNDGYCQNDYCDRVRARLWGSNYTAFKADTTYYHAGFSDPYLKVKIDWEEGAMHDSTELWVTVVKYPSARDTIPLFRLGAEVSQITTQQFGPGDEGVVIYVPDFQEGGNEAAAIIMSLVATSHSYFEPDCEPHGYCLPRYIGWPTDLDYSYSFGVFQDGGGCPFVEVATSEGMAPDNNVLAGAVFRTDALDAYRLERRPQAVDGAYELRLTEQHDDLSHFDRVALLTVDHPPGTEVCVLPGGEIRTYAVDALPSACYSESGADLLGAVSGADGDVAILPPGSWIEAEFPFSGRGGGGVGTRGGPSQKIPPPPGGRGAELEGNTLDLGALCYRANPWTSVTPMPANAAPGGDHIQLRFTAPTEFRIDELFLADISVGDPVIRECEILSATHSTTGDCSEVLAGDDGVRTELSRGEVIDLSFAAPELDSGLLRDFVLVTEGYYGPDEEYRTFEESAPSAVKISDPRPNPFTGATSIGFEIPAPGGRVSVRVYALSGRLVRRLGNDVLPGGTYELPWDGRDDGGERVASGVYFYQIEGAGLQARRKMVLLR